MAEDSTTTQDLFNNDMETLLKKPKEPVAGPFTSSEWPTLPATQKETSLPASSVRHAKKTPAIPAVPVSWTTKKKTPKNYEDRGSKYARYFNDNSILPIPELVAETELKTLSFIVTDLRTQRLAGLKKRSHWRAPQDNGNPKPVRQPTKLHHLGCPAVLWGTSS